MNPSQPPTSRASALTASARLSAFISSWHGFRECGHWPQCPNALRKWAAGCVATGLLLVMAMLLAGPESARAQSEGDLRLEDGRRNHGSLQSDDGRLEVYHNGQWGTVCDIDFTFQDAYVACTQLGYSGEDELFRPRHVDYSAPASDQYHAPLAPEDRPIWLGTVQCSGREDRLVDCRSADLGAQQCAHTDDVWVSCTANDNHPATGAPTITGTVQVGKPLTVDSSDIVDANGRERAFATPRVGYVWLADGVKFNEGSWEKTVTLTVAQLSKRIEVQVSFRDDQGFDEVLTSEPTALVVAADAADNTPATGLLTITGTAQVGQTLTADTSGIADGNGLRLGRFHYQWLADDVVIDGATDATHSLTVAQLSMRIKVQVSIQDDHGFEETRTSGPTDAVVAADPAGNTPATGNPTITGTLQAGETLTAHTSDITDGNGLRLYQFRYQWLVDDTPIAGATSSTYTLLGAQVATRIKVRVHIRDDHGFEEARTSRPTDAVVAADDTNPSVVANDGDIRLTGGATGAAGLLEIYYDGQWGIVCGDTILPIDAAVACRQMGFADGTLSRKVAIEQDRQVFLDFVRCNGGESNLLQCDDNGRLGENLSCILSAGGAIIACSAAVTNQAPTGKPGIAGAPGVKRTLTVRTREIRDPDGPVPLSFTYQWLADDVAIPGAIASTYTLAEADAGKTISVRVTYTDADGTVETLSARKGVVRAATQATGVPRITGRIVVGQTVTADTSGIRDPDGLDISGFTYQWLADDAEIAGETASTYTLTLADRGKEIKVRVGFTDVFGFPGTATSAASRLTGFPKIRERFPQVERVVTADTSDVGPSSLSFTYQWLADDVAISGATDSTYTLTTAEEGKQMKVRVTFNDASNMPVTVTSAGSNPVDEAGQDGDVRLADGTSSRGLLQVNYGGVWGIVCDDGVLDYEAAVACRQLGFAGGDIDTKSVDSGNRPVWLDSLVCNADESRLVDCGHKGLGTSLHCSSGFIIECHGSAAANQEPTGLPTITGTARVGEVLSVDTSGIADADGPGTLTFTYQWLADAMEIDSATQATYTLIPDDQGKQITVAVSFTDGANNEEKLTSEPTEVVGTTNQVPTGSPAITGTARVGEALSVDTSGITDADGPDTLSFMYQWLADGVQIDGATEATYTPEVADAGKRITVAVSFTDDGGTTEELTSQPTEAVVARQMAMTEVAVLYAGGAYTAAEGGGGAVVTLNLSPDPEREVAIPIVATTASTATASDYTISPMTVTFANGETSKQVTITAVDDAVDDDGESVTLGFGTLPNGVVKIQGADTVSVTLVDNDTRGVVVSPEHLRVTEGNSEDYTVVLESAPTAAVTVEVTGHAGTELTVSPARLTFTADNWPTAQTVEVSAAEDDDALDEAEVVLSHAVSGADYGGETAGDVTVTVLENDTAVLAIADAEGPESTGTLGFEVSLDTASSKVVTVAYATADGTALAGSDYTAVEGTLTFAPGSTAAQTIEVAITDDPDDEEEQETFTVVLSHAANAELGDARAAGTITDDDDPAVVVTFGAASYTAAEGGDAAVVTVGLNVDPERTLEVPLTVEAGGGASAEDYTVSAATLTFASGETSKEVTVTAVDDAVDDDGERVVLGIGTALPEGVRAGETGTTEVALSDDDERGVMVSKTALTVTEGDTAVTYTVVLESEPTAAVTVEVTGHADTDLVVSPTRLTFTADNWPTAQTVSVSAAEDDDALADLEVVLSHAVSGGDYTDETAGDVTVTILENDASTLAIADAEGSEDVGTLRFEVSLSQASSEAVTADYTTADATAEAGTDYTAVSGTLTFAAGTTASQTIEVAITDDPDDEEEQETFTVVLSHAANAQLGDARATGTIADNDDPVVVVTFGAAGDTAAEGGDAAVVTVALNVDPERTLEVPLTLEAGGGASADDYTVSAMTLTFASGETTKNVTVTAVDDAVDDDGERVVLGIGTPLPEGVRVGDTATTEVALSDDDERGVRLSQTALTVTEGGASELYTVVLGSEPTAAVTVEVTGHAGTDLTLSPTRLTFTAMDWAVAQTVEVSAAEDDDALADPQVVLSHAVSGGDYAGETAGGVTVTVLENDAPTLAIADAQGSENVGTLRFEVSLSTASSKTVTVAYATEDATALAGSDYTAVQGTLTFAPGSTASQPLTVSITDDRADEPESETFTVVLSQATNATLGDASATGTILDNDVAVVRNASPVAVGALVEQALRVGGEPAEVGVSEAFRDADGDALLYTAASSDRSVAVARVSGATVTVTPVGVGLAMVTVRATDTSGASVVQTFEVTVTLELSESALRLEPQPDGGTLVVYEAPSEAWVRIEVPAARVGVRVLDTDGDGDVDGADALPMVSPVLASELPPVSASLRVTVDRSSAVDITFPAQTVSGDSRVRVCLATTLAGGSLSLYRYDAVSGEWTGLASEVEERDGRRFVCAWVDGFSVFAVFDKSELSVGSVADVNGDGELDGDDALVMYYAYELGELLGDGDTGGVGRFRRTLLAGLSGGPSPSDAALMEMLRKSQAWRASGVDAGGDVNGDGELDGDDALVMYYAYELGELLGDGESGGVGRFRRTLLAGPSGRMAPSDADLMGILRNANRLREERP